MNTLNIYSVYLTYVFKEVHSELSPVWARSFMKILSYIWLIILF